MWLSGVCATKTKKDFIIIRKKRTTDTITFCYIYMLLLHSSLSSFQYLIHALISHTHTHSGGKCQLPTNIQFLLLCHSQNLDFIWRCNVFFKAYCLRWEKLFHLHISFHLDCNGWSSSSYYVIISERPKKLQRPWLSHP